MNNTRRQKLSLYSPAGEQRRRAEGVRARLRACAVCGDQAPANYTVPR